MGPLSQFYGARAMGATVDQTAETAKALSSQMPLNYSPTAFLVQAMADESVRSVDYVATLAFVNATGYQKAQRLSSNPVP
jgi:hypothetical protein